VEHIELKPGEIHFFYSVVGEIQSSLLEKYRGISSQEEQSKIDRYRFERDRRCCLVTRGLIRFVLSQCTHLPPQSFEFQENRYGKPRLKTGVTDIPLQFNLSHARGLTACAVALDHEIGIDVEDSRRKVEMNIADRFFSRQESVYLGQAGKKDKQGVFFDFWTLKESYIKAKGMGLSIPLDKFSFTMGKDYTAIEFDDTYPDDPDNFSFFRFSLPNDFKAAITIQAPKIMRSKVKIYQCIPFEEIKQQDRIRIV
jgi:4'-phosphopantetheinyl transferase